MISAIMFVLDLTVGALLALLAAGGGGSLVTIYGLLKVLGGRRDEMTPQERSQYEAECTKHYPTLRNTTWNDRRVHGLPAHPREYASRVDLTNRYNIAI